MPINFWASEGWSPRQAEPHREGSDSENHLVQTSGHLATWPPPSLLQTFLSLNESVVSLEQN